MTTTTTPRWRDLRAEMTRADLRMADVAERLGLSYAKFATLMAAEVESQPTPEFAERVLAAIRGEQGAAA